MTPTKLRRICATTADALCARETNRRTGAPTPNLTALHDGPVLSGLAAHRTAWGSLHGRENDGRSMADVLHTTCCASLTRRGPHEQEDRLRGSTRLFMALPV